MSSFPNSPRLIKGGIVLVDPTSGVVLRVIALQYNPDTLSRTLAVQGTAAEGGDRLEALRLKGPPIETIKLEAEIDATDQLEFPEQNPNAAKLGVQPELALLETLLYPRSSDLQANNRLAQIGTLEITPVQAPLTLFVWGANRIVPVRITEFGIVEEAFDPLLNPIRAKVSLGLRVLSVNDLDFGSKGGSLFMIYQQQKESLAQKARAAALPALGIGGI
ncbi:MAG TPA: hypothetical protein VFB96_04325 [Pirellulaceae bacterium]|nr:hypothetical protein [Pirellulaceae bacterium]